jgi:hypothetical protein
MPQTIKKRIENAYKAMKAFQRPSIELEKLPIIVKNNNSIIA